MSWASLVDIGIFFASAGLDLPATASQIRAAKRRPLVARRADNACQPFREPFWILLPLRTKGVMHDGLDLLPG